MARRAVCGCSDDLSSEDLLFKRFDKVCDDFRDEFKIGITANLGPYAEAMEVHRRLTGGMFDFHWWQVKECKTDVDLCVERVRRSIEGLGRYVPTHSGIGKLRDIWMQKLELLVWFYSSMHEVYDGTLKAREYDKMQWYSSFVATEMAERRVSMRRVERVWRDLRQHLEGMTPYHIRERVRDEFGCVGRDN